MYCPTCHREWKPRTRFCVVCGSELNRRSEQSRELELQHVHWLLDEISRWDRFDIAPQARRVLTEQYEWRAGLLEMPEAPEPEVASAPPVHVSPIEADPPAVETAASRVAPPEPVQAEASPPLAAEEEEEVFAAPQPSSDDRVVAAASTWNRIWKPFLTESVGWFIGGFLILAGTLSLVGNAWETLSDSMQALTVFGFAGGWTLAFVTWARFLLRREHTRGAGVVLERIAAIIAPLATVAVGPIRDNPILFWPLVMGWSAVAAWLARAATRRVETTAALPVAVAIGLATVMMGAAPFITALGPGAVWFSMVPLALCAVAWVSGPREKPQATWFLFAAMLYATALFTLRVDVALRMVGLGPSVSTYAPMIAALASFAMWLRPRPTHAADAWSVVVVSAQSVLLVPAFFGQPPAFVLAALIASHTSARLAAERITKASARWVVPAYAFAYFAFQHVDQLVPGYVTELFALLKAKLGYAASAPLPASYVSIYAAIFVIVVGLFAARRFVRHVDARQAEADMLLWCTAVAAVLFGGMAVLSIDTDVRPAIVATPLLMTLGLALGLWLDRRELTISGTVLAVATAFSYGVWSHSALPVASVALLLAALSIFATRKHRAVLSVAALVLAFIGAVGSFAGPPDLRSCLALAAASLAALAVARNFSDRTVLAYAWLLPFALVARTAQRVDPASMPAALALAALLGAWASRKVSRLETLWVPSSLVALLAASTGYVTPGSPLSVMGRTLTGFEVPLAAAALLVGAHVERRRKLAVPFEIAGLIIATSSLLSPLGSYAVFEWMDPRLSMGLCVAVAAAASGWALRAGRSWQTALVASMVCLISLTNVAVVVPSTALIDLQLTLSALVFLVATPALIASVTLPVALSLFALAAREHPSVMMGLAIGAALVSLFEEFDLTCRYVLNRSRVAWAASLSSAVLLAFATLAFGHQSPIALIVTLALPLIWVRATRSTVLAGLSLVLTFALGTQLDPVFLFLPPVAAVLISRLTDLEPVRTALKLRAPTLGASFFVAAVFIALISDGFAQMQSLGVGLPISWSVALLLMRDNLLPARVVAAAVTILAVPAAWPPAALVLVAMALGLRHRGARTARLFGAESSGGLAAPTAILAAVSLALLHVGLFGGATSHAVLATTVVFAGVLFDWPLAVALAVASLGLNLHGLAHGTWPVLTPFAQPVALISALAAAVLRVPTLSAPLEHVWARLSGKAGRELATPLWVGAFVIGVASLTMPGPLWLLLVPLLLLTPNAPEGSLALPLGAAMVVLNVSHETAGLIFALAGTVLAWSAVFLEQRLPVSRTWHHAGWVLSLLALGFCTDLHAHHLAEVWALMALTMWAVVKRKPALELVGFGATLAAAHAVLAHVGVALSTGAPEALILPWFSLASILVAAWPLAKVGSNARQRFGVAVTLLSIGELAAGVVLLDVPYAREGLVGVVAMTLAVALLASRAVNSDEPVAAVVAQLAVAAGVISVTHLGLGRPIGVTETWACLVFGFALSELAKRAPQQVASALRLGAYVWPVVGLTALLDQPPTLICWGLMAIAAHFTLMARSTAARGKAAIAAVLAFNAAMFFGYQATGWDGPQYLAIPFGVSMLTLLWVFKGSLEASTAAKLRAVAIAVVYGAAAWRPLLFDSSWALWLCVLICVFGVAAGIVLRIRSFVFLGTAFMVTSVVANLVRYGLRDARAGAIFLSGLGLLVVGFMVLVTTKRAELLVRYRSVQQLLARWEG